MGVEIVKSYSENIKGCKVCFVHAKLSNITEIATKVHNDIMDTSWLSELKPLSKISYEQRAKDTINNIVKNILNKVTNSVTEGLGELIVSTQGQFLLEQEHNHRRLPLAELWKEKERGNPGFDFHTESPSDYITFGEAKYNSNQTAYGKALTQINNFIDKGKDKKEMSDLEHFTTEKAQANFLLPTGKAFAAAFSVHSDDSDTIFGNIKKCDKFKELLKYPELYLIGIQIVN